MRFLSSIFNKWGIQMSRIIMLLLLAVVSNSAVAEWVKVGESEFATIYTDSSTIRKNANMTKMWVLMDNKEAQKINDNDTATYLSSKSLYEYDCKKRQYRTFSVTNFAGKMGAGNITADIVNTAEGLRVRKEIQPDSINESIWKYACSKKSP